MKPRERKIWVFDFDGTLSPIVPHRDAAALDPDCEDLLRALAGDPEQAVAVVSSRSLEDLRSRVRLEHITLSGASGLEWWLPGGHWIRPNRAAVARLARQRRKLLPLLERVKHIPGAELEDKSWSAAVHFRGVEAEHRILIARTLERLRLSRGLSVYNGPDVSEVQFLPEVSKEIAVKTLMRLFGSAHSGRDMLFAGDDQNDAQAMRWVSARRGVVYIVGRRIAHPEAHVVSSPAGLARALRRRYPWVGADPEHGGRVVRNG